MILVHIRLLIFDFFYPFLLPLSHDPFPDFDLISTNQLPTFIMLFALMPLPYINFPVIEIVLTFSVKSVLKKLSDILHSIRPGQLAYSFHFAILPVSSILLAADPNICT